MKEIVFWLAPVVGLLVLAWIGHKRVRVPREELAREHVADEWMKGFLGGAPPTWLPSGRADLDLRTAFRRADESSRTAESLRDRASESGDDELFDFYGRFAATERALADEAAEILERRFVTGAITPNRGEPDHPEPPPPAW